MPFTGDAAAASRVDRPSDATLMLQCDGDSWLPYLGEGRALSVCLDGVGRRAEDCSDKNHNSAYPAVKKGDGELRADRRAKWRPRNFTWCRCFACSCVQAQGSDVTAVRSPTIEDAGELIDLRSLTNDAVMEWRDSFEKLLRHKAGRSVFGEFLKTEYSEENLLFWSACEDLKLEENDGLVEDKARAIYDNYISILSPREVSLDSRVRDIINESMVRPCKKTFDEAQSQIYMLMYRDSYPRFLNSKFFTQLLNGESFKKA